MASITENIYRQRPSFCHTHLFIVPSLGNAVDIGVWTALCRQSHGQLGLVTPHVRENLVKDVTSGATGGETNAEWVEIAVTAVAVVVEKTLLDANSC